MVRQCCWVLGTKTTSHKLPAWHWHAVADLQSPCNRAKRDSSATVTQERKKEKKRDKPPLLPSRHSSQQNMLRSTLSERETMGRGSTQMVCLLPRYGSVRAGTPVTLRERNRQIEPLWACAAALTPPTPSVRRLPTRYQYDVLTIGVEGAWVATWPFVSLVCFPTYDPSRMQCESFRSILYQDCCNSAYPPIHTLSSHGRVLLAFAYRSRP